MSSKWSNKETNYCLKEANDSYSCLAKNGYNQKACQKYFEAYRRCKRDLNKIKSERRWKGLPANPPCREEKSSSEEEVS